MVPPTSARHSAKRALVPPMSATSTEGPACAVTKARSSAVSCVIMQNGAEMPMTVGSSLRCPATLKPVHCTESREASGRNAKAPCRSRTSARAMTLDRNGAGAAPLPRRRARLAVTPAATLGAQLLVECIKDAADERRGAECVPGKTSGARQSRNDAGRAGARVPRCMTCMYWMQSESACSCGDAGVELAYWADQRRPSEWAAHANPFEVFWSKWLRKLEFLRELTCFWLQQDTPDLVSVN